jgi:acylphosphatase
LHIVERFRRALLKVRAHVYVSGRVQGVFFRSETQDEAIRQGITGWVRNLPDGQVEAILEGERENVEKVIEFCRRGPPAAKVAKVDVQWQNFTGEFRNFTVKHGYH